MFQVGSYLNPLPGDASFPDLTQARQHAETMAAKCRNTPVAIWGVDNETLYLFLNGEEFQCI
ncbi:hypothetical protein [Geopseudomonas aromaticivorans]